MKLRSVAGAVMCVILVVSVARGDGEKILRLKNGRSIQGEVEATENSYIVKTAGGTTTIAKDAVASVEDAPTKDPVQPTRPDDGKATVASPTTPRPNQGPPLAPVSDVATAKKLLLAVPAEDGTDAGKLARAKALQTVRERVALKTLVAIVAEPVAKTPTNDRVLALSLVRAEPADKVRPLLLHAVTDSDFAQGPRTDLMAALASFPRDKEGELARVLFAKADELRKDGLPLEDFSRPMAETRAHDRLATLHEWLLSPTTKPASVPGVAALCQAIQSTLDEPDPPLLELVKKLADVKDLYRFRYACVVLRDSDGRVASPLMRLIRPIERKADAQLTIAPETVECLSEAYLTLALLPSPNVPPSMASAIEGYGYLLTALDTVRSHDLRKEVLTALTRIRTTNECPTKDFLDRLLGIIAQDGHLNEAEVTGGINVLKHLTGKDYGPDLDAWRKFVDKFER